jgi:putative ABC transport system permease protein
MGKNQIIMLRNYFITAIRSIIRNKIQSFIQVLSLAIGITAVILIGLYAKNEFSYDRFNEKSDRIYRLEYGQAGLPSAIGHQIKQEIPEVENVVRLLNWEGRGSSLYLRYIPANDSTNAEMVKIENYFYCDSTIFDVFTFNLIQGDPKSALRDPNTCVLSESTARRIFGDRDPVGETLGGMTVTGIIEDVKNSHIEINMLLSIVSLKYAGRYSRGDPGYLNYYGADFSYMTYLLLPEEINPSYIVRRVNDFFSEKIRTGSSEYFNENIFFSLRALKDIYFSTNQKVEKNYCKHGNIKLLRVLLTVAIIILILAVINYINLTTARASLRAKEVGIRKVSGSSKTSLINQFLIEAILVTIFSLLVALTLVQLLMPGFNELASTDLDLVFINKQGTWVIFLISGVSLGLISGIYPAVYLTGYQPVAFLSGKQVKGAGSVIFRRVLFTFQFTISITLIIGVFVIFRQLNYMKSADLGFNKELIINVQGNWGYNFSTRQLFRQKLLENPNIKGVAFSDAIMGGELYRDPIPVEIDGVKKHCDGLPIDPGFIDVMEIELLDGRNLSWDRAGDYAADLEDLSATALINETGVREFGLEAPVGFVANWGNYKYEIIGVVRDFNFKSQHEKIRSCLYYWFNSLPKANIKIAPTNIPATLKYIKKEFQILFPDAVFDYSFLEETYNQQYFRDEKTVRIISNFAIVAILISCLGLFGLSSFMAARRTKEIGIRKAMGASNQSVFLMLSREFIKWVVLSIMIACPVAWFIMNKWLQSFAYRTNISWWIFALAILIAFAIAFVTVTWQSLKTARTNPLEALRYE